MPTTAPMRASANVAGVAIANGRGEKLEEAPRRLLAGAGDRRRHDDVPGNGSDRSGSGDRGKFVHGPICNITSFLTAGVSTIPDG
jgi:hypothetical protein